MKKIGFFIVGILFGMVIVFAGFNAVEASSNRWGGGISPERKLTEIYNFLNQNSLAEFDMTDMLEEMYRAFVNTTDDPYTRYMSAREAVDFNARFDATFVGVGITVLFDPETDTTNIMSVIRGTPAERAGLLAGDRIVNVDGTSMIGMRQEDVVSYVLGTEGEPVVITIYRPLEDIYIEFEIIREKIIIPSVFHEMLDNRIGYIRLESFDRGTESMMLDAIAELKEQGMKGLVLDVRNNPGGLLDVAINLSSHFVPPGVVTFTEDINNVRSYYRVNGEPINIPLVYLINEFSASASEVLGGAIQDTETGVLVGVQSFGKGSVQRAHVLQDGSAVMTTISRYFTPLGWVIHVVGLTPDHIVELDEDYTRRIGMLELEEDLQLQFAVELLIEMLK